MRILIVDDEAMQREMLAGFLKKQDYDVYTAAGGEDALALFSRMTFELVLLDHRMPDMNGDEVLDRMKTMNPLVHAIMITAYGSVDTAVKVMKSGADDFMEKPIDIESLLEKIQTIEQATEVEAEAAQVIESVDRFEPPLEIVGSSQAVKDVLSTVRRIAPTRLTVLVRGETGTGKELIARLIHLLSPMRKGPFITVNCSAIPENLFESELFGHVKGAFTGATADRRGRFEAADGGSLFLDEVGELPLGLQPKLLRVLQEKRITRVGGEKDIAVEVRLIAATNRDLKQRVKEGLFREDLYYRLQVLDLELPALRYRKEDIPELVDFFLKQHALRPVKFHPAAITALGSYDFPGNIRELENIVQKVATLTRGNLVKEADLPPEVRHLLPATGNLSDALEATEKEMILSALEKQDWVQTRAAEVLNISERVLRYKMKKLGIRKP